MALLTKCGAALVAFDGGGGGFVCGVCKRHSFLLDDFLTIELLDMP